MRWSTSPRISRSPAEPSLSSASTNPGKPAFPWITRSSRRECAVRPANSQPDKKRLSRNKGGSKMDEAIVQQIIDELLSSLEPLETQNAALLQFLKAKGIATDEELAPFLDQAGNASNIRWRAVRVRTAALISSA